MNRSKYSKSQIVIIIKQTETEDKDFETSQAQEPQARQFTVQNADRQFKPWQRNLQDVLEKNLRPFRKHGYDPSTDLFNTN